MMMVVVVVVDEPLTMTRTRTRTRTRTKGEDVDDLILTRFRNEVSPKRAQIRHRQFFKAPSGEEM